MARPVYINSLQAATLVAPKGPIRIIAIYLGNQAGATTYVQFFNTGATANVTLGSTVPDMELPLGSALTQAFTISDMSPLAFGNGLVVAATTASNGGTTSAAGVILNLVVD